MEYYAYPSASASESESESGRGRGRGRGRGGSSIISKMADKLGGCLSYVVSALLGSLLSAFFTFCFALVGTLLGAMTGALIGQETESGFLRGAAIGAISGAVFSIEVFESSLLLWRSDESGIRCLLYLIDVIASLLSGRLVRERIGPAMLSAVQSQMGAVETHFEEVTNIFDTGGAKALSPHSVDNIPKIKITTNHNLDRLSCSVCLQDFQIAETVRSLPHCHHMFHLPCIDKWLLRHGSCPLCRRDL